MYAVAALSRKPKVVSGDEFAGVGIIKSMVVSCLAQRKKKERRSEKMSYENRSGRERTNLIQDLYR